MSEPTPIVPRASLDWSPFRYSRTARRVADSLGALLTLIADGIEPDSLDPPVTLCHRGSRPYPVEIARFAIATVADSVDIDRLKDHMRYGAQLVVCAQHSDGDYTVGITTNETRPGEYADRPAFAVRVYPKRDAPALLALGLLRNIGAITGDKFEWLPTVGIDVRDDGSRVESHIVTAMTEVDVFTNFGRSVPIAEAP